MKYTDSKQLKIGEYYCIFLEDDPTKYGIIRNMGCGKSYGKRDRHRIIGDIICNMQNGKFIFERQNKSTNIFVVGRETIPATEEQRQWLDECSKQGKFIPFEQIKIIANYEIY